MNIFQYNLKTTQAEIENFKYNDLLNFDCPICKKIFQRSKNELMRNLRDQQKIIVCSKECRSKKNDTRIKSNCTYCNKEIIRQKKKLKINNFCSLSCMTTYNNINHITNKKAPEPVLKNCTYCNKEFKLAYYKIKYRTNNNFFCSRSCLSYYNKENNIIYKRRSKIEIYIEEELCKKFDFAILYNSRKTIKKLELDIYIPHLKIAFELNGPNHYEPIFGKKQLEYVQNNDVKKEKLCTQSNIRLCTYDIRWVYKNNIVENYNKILNNIINEINLTNDR